MAIVSLPPGRAAAVSCAVYRADVGSASKHHETDAPGNIRHETSGLSLVRQIERKEKGGPIDRTLSASSNGRPQSEIGRFKTTNRQTGSLPYRQRSNRKPSPASTTVAVTELRLSGHSGAVGLSREPVIDGCPQVEPHQSWDAADDECERIPILRTQSQQLNKRAVRPQEALEEADFHLQRRAAQFIAEEAAVDGALE